MVNIAAYEVPEPGIFDNRPSANQHLVAVPLASALGAEIQGLDLANLNHDQFGELEAALYHHKIVYLRDQHLSYDDQEQLTARFGAFGVDAYTTGVEGHENIQRVVKEADEQRPMVFGGTWHTDSAFLERPPSISMLYAVDVPPFGGDTWWANTQLAYAFLSETMKAMIAPLRVHMSARNVLRAIARQRRGDEPAMTAVADELSAEEMMVRGNFHPLVRTHPRTGKRGLYVDQTYSVGIEGLKKHEAAALIGFLVEHLIQPVFTCRLRWKKNTFVMWDNRSTVHHAFNDYDGYRREMYRTIVQGEVPA